jgi:hypothetical protein
MHVDKVIEWGIKLVDGDVLEFPVKYGCTKCDIESDTKFPDEQQVSIDHSNCEEEPCFYHKAKGLQLSRGDARHDGVPSAKAHDRELGSYYDAIRQGVEPISTKQKDIDAAVRLSNDTGVAFDGNKI